MALPELRGVARILSEPRRGTTKTNDVWCSVLAKFETWSKGDDGKFTETDGVIVSVMAFGDTARKLATFAKGDKVGVHGTVRPDVWKDKPQLKVTLTDCWAPERQPAGEAVP